MKKIYLSLLLLISYHSQADDSALDLPIITPLSASDHMSYPDTSELYRACSNGAESVESKQSRADWAFCSGFIRAAAQATSKNEASTCPSLSLRKILKVIDKQNHDYETMHSDPLYDNKGNLVGTTLHPDFVDPWKFPAFPVVVKTLKELGCK